MALMWKVLVGLFLTVPAGAYVAGTVVGPYDTAAPPGPGVTSPPGPTSEPPAAPSPRPAGNLPATASTDTVIFGPALGTHAVESERRTFKRREPGDDRETTGPEVFLRHGRAPTDQLDEESTESPTDSGSESPTPDSSQTPDDTSSEAPGDTTSETPDNTTTQAPDDSTTDTPDGTGTDPGTVDGTDPSTQ